MTKLPSYYSRPLAEERLRPLVEELVLHGWSYDFALGSLQRAAGWEPGRGPRYGFTMSRDIVRLWGKPLLHNGRKS